MKALKATAMDHSHYMRIHMTAAVPPGTTLEDVTEPSYWANHAFRLRPGAIIEVLSEDNTLDCELRVMELGPTFAKVRVLRQYVEKTVPRREQPVNLIDEVKCEYANKTDRWRVVHKGEVIRSGFGTEKEALAAADEYRSKLAA